MLFFIALKIVFSPQVLSVTQVSVVDGPSRSLAASAHHPPLSRKFSPIMPGEPRSDSPLSVSSTESGRAPLTAYTSNDNSIGIPTAAQLPSIITSKSSSKNSNSNMINNNCNNNNNNSNNDYHRSSFFSPPLLLSLSFLRARV